MLAVVKKLKKYIIVHRALFAAVGVATALIIAALYMVFPPAEAAEASGFSAFMLRYGHSLSWLLLAFGGVSWLVTRTTILLRYLGYIAAAIYVVFIATLITAESGRDVKTGTIVRLYDNTPHDGCSGYELSNGEHIDALCFSNPPIQLDVRGPVKVGDVVEYGKDEGGSYIRPARSTFRLF